MMRAARRGSSPHKTPRAAFGGLATGLVLLCIGACADITRDPNVIVLASGSDLESANPVVTVHTMSRQMQRHMLFMPLVRLDSLLQPEPWLARQWMWNDDRTALTFALRTDITWHDGERTTARDVVLTFEAAKDPATGSPRAGDLVAMRRVVALNDSSVQFEFDAPQFAFPLIFAELPSVPAHILDTVPRAAWRRHEFSTAPVGNGPFVFISRTAGQRWRFARNTSFPTELGGPPPSREVVIAVVDEPATKFAGLVSGELDAAGVSPAMATLVARDPLLQLETPPVLFTTVLAFNTTRPPFDDARVRRAIAASINRQRIVDAAVAGYGVPATQAIPPGVFPDNAQTNTAPTASASVLLDSAQWMLGSNGIRSRAGKRLELTLITVGSGDLAAEQLLQDDLRRIGITLTIRTVELASFLNSLRADVKEFDVAYTGLPGDLSLGHLTSLFHSAQRGGALDYTGYHTPTLDSLLDRARRAPTVTEQQTSWQRVSEHLDSVAPVAFVYHGRGVQGRARSLDGVVMDLRGELTSISRWRRRQ